MLGYESTTRVEKQVCVDLIPTFALQRSTQTIQMHNSIRQNNGAAMLDCLLAQKQWQHGQHLALAH